MNLLERPELGCSTSQNTNLLAPKVFLSYKQWVRPTSASFAMQQWTMHPFPLSSTAEQWVSCVLLARVNKHDHAIITSVNKHDLWVSQDMAPVHSKQPVGEENVGCADSESWYRHFQHHPARRHIPLCTWRSLLNPGTLLGGFGCPFSNTNSAWNI